MLPLGGNWVKGTRNLCIISYNFIRIYNYLNKNFNEKKMAPDLDSFTSYAVPSRNRY